jgi:hypothetical protein
VSDIYAQLDRYLDSDIEMEIWKAVSIKLSRDLLKKLFMHQATELAIALTKAESYESLRLFLDEQKTI